MLNVPCFHPAYIVKTLQPDTVFFISERKSVSFQNSTYYRLVKLINGKNNVDRIIDIMQSELIQQQEVTEEEIPNFFQSVLNFSLQIQRALFELENQGYILEQSGLLPANLAILCHQLNISESQAYHQLRATKVTVKTLGTVVEEDCIAILKSFQIQVAETGDLTIVLTDDYLHPELEKINQQALADKTPWILVKPVGTITWMGPLFAPQQTGCWDCFAQRWRNNRPVEEFINRQQKVNTSLNSPLGFSTATIQTALSMAGMEVFKWIIQGQNNQSLQGNLISFDTIHQQTQNHTVVKLPQCLSCGSIFNQQPLPVVLGHRKKAFTKDGGHRFCPPEETLQKYQHHISPITGVVRELTKIPSEGLIHTYIAKHHYRNVFDNLDNLRKNIAGRSAGKGGSDTQARASGFCEAIERYSGVFQGYEITEKASYQELKDKAIHPHECMNFSQKQYQNRTQWNRDCQGWFQKVPEPFDESRMIDWTPVWSLTHQAFKYLPTAYCYYGYPQTPPLDCWADSNGCAAGNTLEEAILQGFMELVERDSVALWWYNRLSKPQVNLDSFHEAYFTSLQKYYHSLDRDLWVLDLTSDLNIPCFAAISPKKNGSAEDILLGYGAHFDANIAIARALTEVNQILPNVLTHNADGSTLYPPSADPLAIAWWQQATLANQPYLLPDRQIISKESSDYLPLASDDLLEDVQLCQQIVEQNGMEMLVLDQTRPDIGLRVAKVIVPGLRHMWKRLGPGRLYDVPVKMGWLKQPLREDELNSFPMWM